MHMFGVLLVICKHTKKEHHFDAPFVLAVFIFGSSAIAPIPFRYWGLSGSCMLPG